MSFITSQNRAVIDDLSTMITNSIRKRLNFKGNINTGKGSASLETKARSLAEGLVFDVSGEKYLRFQDEGRKPGTFPNVKALRKWVQRKGIESNLKKSKSIAWAIAINMNRIGMHSKNKRLDLSKRNFLSEGFNEINQQFEARLFKAFEINFEITSDNFAKQLRQK